MLWHTRHGKLSLLAAVHVMDGEGCIPSAAMKRAYGGAKRVVFESDLDGALYPDLATMLTLPGRGRLEQLVPEPLWSRMRDAWTAVGLPTESLGDIPPWRAAISFLAAYGARAGFDPAKGVDRHFWERAGRDGLTRGTLETSGSAIAAFWRIPLDEQLRMLDLFVVAERTVGDLSSMTQAWRKGDGATFDVIRRQRLAVCPTGFEFLLAGRNRAWMPELARLAADGVPTLVVVGALHCYGPDGLLTLMNGADLPIDPQ